MSPHRIASTLRFGLLAAAAATCVRAMPAADHGAGIRVDGRFSEWRVSGAAATAPAIRWSADANQVHALIDLPMQANLQALPTPIRLTLDTDGNAATGETIDGIEGADLVIAFTGDSADGIFIRLPPDPQWQTSYVIGLVYAPTHSSTRFEIGIRRKLGDGRVLLSGQELRGRMTVLDSTSDVAQDAAPFAVPLPPARPSLAAGAAAAAVARVPGTDLRVLTWNVGDRTPLRHPDPFRRILHALDPDVVLFDELNPSIDDAFIRALLRPGEWSVRVSPHGGRQRTAVASRWPLRPAAAIPRVEYPDSISALAEFPVSRLMRQDLRSAVDDGVPASLVLATVRGRDILFVPLDLFCCGRIGSAEDRARVMSAAGVAAAVRTLFSAGEAEGVIVGGDLNLVGSTRPLEILQAAGDPPLMAVDAISLDGQSVSTWRSPGPFPPGRLDWLLYSPGSLQALRGFVFDAALLDDAALRELALQGGDSDVVDHLPVVADLRIVR